LEKGAGHDAGCAGPVISAGGFSTISCNDLPWRIQGKSLKAELVTELEPQPTNARQTAKGSPAGVSKANQMGTDRHGFSGVCGNRNTHLKDEAGDLPNSILISVAP
jgi:hypothetical protein